MFLLLKNVTRSANHQSLKSMILRPVLALDACTQQTDIQSLGWLQYLANRKIPKNWDTRKFAVITLKAEQCGFSLD